MKLKKRCFIFLIMILAIFWFPIIGTGEELTGKSLLILADVSGSMQNKIKIYQENQEIKKIELLKNLLIQISNEISNENLNVGIYKIFYKSGQKEFYSPFLPIASYNKKDIMEKINNDFVVKYPIFNRRTPLMKVFFQLDQNELKNAGSLMNIVLISDGNDNFYNSNDAVKEIQKLKEKYGTNFIVHTIYIGNKDNESDKGQNLLKQIAVSGGGKNYSAQSMFEQKSLITEFCTLICQ